MPANNTPRKSENTPEFPEALLCEKQVCSIIGMSRHGLRSKVVAGEFPKPVMVGVMRSSGRPSRIAWLQSEVLEWVRQLAEQPRPEWNYASWPKRPAKSTGVQEA